MESLLEKVLYGAFSTVSEALMKDAKVPKVSVRESRKGLSISYDGQKYLIAKQSSKKKPGRAKKTQIYLDDKVFGRLKDSGEFRAAEAFREIRRREYRAAGFKDAEQRAVNDEIIFALKTYKGDKLGRFFKGNGKKKVKKSRGRIVTEVPDNGKAPNEIEILLGPGTGRSQTGNPSWMDYHLIMIPKEYLDAFPGYKKPMTFVTNIGEIKTHLSSSRAGTRNGARSGGYITQGLKPWYDENKPRIGDTLVIKRLGRDYKFSLSVKRKK